MARNILFVSLFLALFFSACVPDTDTFKTDIKINFSDPTFTTLLDLQDKQQTDSLYKWFRHKDPTYRYVSVLALASIKDSKACDSLLLIVNDPVLEVRAAAVYALGQIGDAKIVDRLVQAFRYKDTINIDNIFNANILEAVGKLGDLNHLKAMATVKTYRSTDTMLLLGQTRGIYRFALRGIIADEGTSAMVDYLYLPTTPYNTRLMAAHYLGRAKNPDLSLHKIRLVEVLNKTSDPFIKMALITGLGKSKEADFISPLKSALLVETDYRVKSNLLRALGNYTYEEVKDVILPLLKDSNSHIAGLAADFVLNQGVKEDFELYNTMVSDSAYWEVRSKIAATQLRHTPIYFTKTKSALSEQIIKSLPNIKNPYEKAAYIAALGNDPFNYLLIHDVIKNHAQESVTKLAAYEALGAILKSPNFFKAFGYGYPKVKAQILEYLIEGLKGGDAGVIAVVSNILKDPALQWKEWIKDTGFMNETLAKLKLPKDIETYNELKSAIAFIEGKEFTPIKNEYNHPIDFTLLQNFTDTTVAAIKTSKGLVRIKLYKNRAPGTVANFVSLVNQKFYNGKIFHRVVPNFVIQTGCPRGDGYGSLDYSIRSELPLIYYLDEGYVGMASAGNHTEGTQWFITHSPTPHLDGNYTIFGKVVEGMDIVHSIQIGDKINEIILVR